jgi:hypothetical protein
MSSVDDLRVGEHKIDKWWIRRATWPQNGELNSSDSRNKKHYSRNILGIKITTGGIWRSLMKKEEQEDNERTGSHAVWPSRKNGSYYEDFVWLCKESLKYLHKQKTWNKPMKCAIKVTGYHPMQHDLGIQVDIFIVLTLPYIPLKMESY